MAGIDQYSYNSGNREKWCEHKVASSAAGEDLKSPFVSEDDTASDVDAAVQRCAANGVLVASLITENLLSHPFVVLRRQCQVHNNSCRYHLIPLTLVPVIVHLYKRQGLTALWKGLGSTLIVRGLTLAVEDIISKFTPWPKEVTWHSSLKSFGQNILLKCTAFAIITPFYSASLVETVQSDIASEKPGIFDVFKEGLCRLVSWGSPQKGRMLPIWSLVVPTVSYSLLKYFFTMIIRGVANRVLHITRKNVQKKQGALHRSVLENASIQDIEVTSALIGLFAADVVFYPFETILHRLHLQGTRTIIDNLDTGYEVIPILTNYEGSCDCYEATINQEGVSGLYKGFGTVIMQFAAHLLVIKLTKFLLSEITYLVRSSSKPSKVPKDSMQPHPVSSSRTLSTSSHDYRTAYPPNYAGKHY